MRTVALVSLSLLIACRNPVECLGISIEGTPADTIIQPGESFIASGRVVSCSRGVVEATRWRSADDRVATVDPVTGEVFGGSQGETDISFLDAEYRLLGQIRVRVQRAGIPFDEILSYTSMTGYDTAAFAIIGDSAALAAVWSRVYALHAPSQVPPEPVVDFATRQVVLAAAGTRGAEGFFWHVADVVPDGDSTRVIILERYPFCGTLPTFSAPVHLVSVPKLPSRAVFTQLRWSASCPP